MKKSYHSISRKGETNAHQLAEFISQLGQGWLPIVDLIKPSRWAVDELMDAAG